MKVYMIHFASSSFDHKRANILHRIDNYRFINFRRELAKDIKSRVANALPPQRVIMTIDNVLLERLLKLIHIAAEADEREY